MSSLALPDIFARFLSSMPSLDSYCTSSVLDGLNANDDSVAPSTIWILASLSTATGMVILASVIFRCYSTGQSVLPRSKISTTSISAKLDLLPIRLRDLGANYWFQHSERFRYLSSRLSNTDSAASEESTLRRQMTSIGRFALRSQSKQNPCIVTFFAALSNKKGEKDMDLIEFEDLWGNRIMEKHERFRSRISATDDRYFEVIDKSAAQHMVEVPHPKIYRKDLQERIEKFLTSDLKVADRLWEGQLSTGPVGASGAISHEQIAERQLMDTCENETVTLFRVHHSLADGVSMSVVLADASDEADELEGLVIEEVKNRRANYEQKSILEKIFICLGTLVLYYILGGIKAILLQSWRTFHSVNPFDPIIAESKYPAGKRTVAWRVLGSVSAMKEVAKAVSKETTINDVSVYVVTAAIKRQLAWHYVQANTNGDVMPHHVNVCVPVHLLGGALVDPKTGDRVPLGNKIGAFVAAIPLAEMTDNHPATGRLKTCSAALKEQKSTPAPLIAWRTAKFLADYAPNSIAKYAMRNTNGHAAAVVSNIKGFPFRSHWNSRCVEFLCAFLPLPPGIPIGCCIQSYSGEMSFSIDADMRAVPDAKKFAEWMLEEYNRLKKEALVGY